MPRLTAIACLLPLLALLCASCLDSGRRSGVTPQVLWQLNLHGARDLTADYIGDNIIICSTSTSLDWVDVRNGSIVYSVTDPQMYGGGTIWFASPDGQVFYMMRDSSYSYGGTQQPSEILSCRDVRGELQWEVSMPPGRSLISTAIGEDRIFLILNDGHVMAVSRGGDTLWYRQLEAVRLTGFAAYISKQLIYLDRDGYLCVADKEGELQWKSPEQMGFYSSTLELPDGSIALYDFPLALRLFSSEGELLWREEFREYSPGRGKLGGASDVSQYSVDRMLDALPGNGVVVAHPDGRLSAYDHAGELLWRSIQTGKAHLICSDSAGNVYGSVRGGNLYAFDSRGRLAWEMDSLQVLNSAPSVDVMGRLFVETETDLYCLDPGFGTLSDN